MLGNHERWLYPAEGERDIIMQSGGYYIISPTQGQGENGWVSLVL